MTNSAELLRPWLGSGAERLALPLPAVIAVRLTGADVELDGLARRLTEAAPGTLVESHGVWIRRLAALARSLQACAGLALLLVAAVAAAVIAVATRAGMAARREAIEIVHGLGATDSYIAARFAGRATLLAATAVSPVRSSPCRYCWCWRISLRPFASGAGESASTTDMLTALPMALWLTLPGLPAAAATIGFVTAQGTVRRWLRRLP